jgi:hypothetical protein
LRSHFLREGEKQLTAFEQSLKLKKKKSQARDVAQQ